MRLISNCCEAEDRVDILTGINYSELEICPKCQEHCEFRDSECPDCGGSGNVLDTYKINSRTISPPYKPCPKCGGAGTV